MVKSVLGKGARKPMPERRRSSCATTKISGCMAKVNEHRAKIGEKQSLAKKERRNLEVVATPYEASYYTKYFHPARTMKEQAMAKDLPLRQERRQKHLAEREKRKASGGLKRTRSAR